MKTSLIKSLITFILILNFRQQSTAQTYVLIPDAYFAGYLSYAFPSAMSGNSLNITSTLVTGATTLNLSTKSISNLNGIQYFTSLASLICNQNFLINLPALPNSLINLECCCNNLTSLPTLPSSLTTLWCNSNYLSNLPTLPNSLITLHCEYNTLTSLPALPNSLAFLTCSWNSLTSLPALPNSLTNLDCGYNNIICFPIFPSSLTNYGVFLGPNPYTCLPNYVLPAMNGYTNTPLCAWNNTAGCIFTGIEEIKTNTSQINIYPNPSSNILSIKNNENKSFDGFVIIDVLGRKVLEQKENTTQINIQSLDKGMYQLVLTSEGKNYWSRFIKE